MKTDEKVSYIEMLRMHRASNAVKDLLKHEIDIPVNHMIQLENMEVDTDTQVVTFKYDVIKMSIFEENEENGNG